MRFLGKRHEFGNKSIDSLSDLCDCKFIDESYCEIQFEIISPKDARVTETSQDNVQCQVRGTIDNEEFELDFSDFIWHVSPASIGSGNYAKWKNSLGEELSKNFDLCDFIGDKLCVSRFYQRLKAVLPEGEIAPALLDWTIEFLLSGIRSHLIKGGPGGFASDLHELVLMGYVPVAYDGRYPTGKLLVISLR